MDSEDMVFNVLGRADGSVIHRLRPWSSAGRVWCTYVREDVRGQRLSGGLRARTHGGVLLAGGPLHGRRVLVGPLGRRRRRALAALARASCTHAPSVLPATTLLYSRQHWYQYVNKFNRYDSMCGNV